MNVPVYVDSANPGDVLLNSCDYKFVGIFLIIFAIIMLVSPQVGRGGRVRSRGRVKIGRRGYTQFIFN